MIKPALGRLKRMEGGESVSIDKSGKEFCCKGEQRNWAASSGSMTLERVMRRFTQMGEVALQRGVEPTAQEGRGLLEQ